MKRRALLGAVAAAPVLNPMAATAAPTHRASTGTDPGGQLQQLLAAHVAAGVPGVFAEVRDGGKTWALAAGVADVDSGRPVQPTMRHRVGSITKTFVATTVLQLAGERRLRLDAPIGNYLPDVVTGRTGRQVTVRMLLNHTSGIGNYTSAILATGDDIVRAAGHTFRPRDLAAVGLILPPVFAPGTSWSYSNTNYVLLGLLIERLTGRAYAAEISRRILRPLRLRDTSFPGTDPSIDGPHAAAYVTWAEGELRDFSTYNMSWAWAAGELISTMADLNVFYRALLTGRLLTPALLAEMKTTVPMTPGAPDAGGYGLGLFWVPAGCGRAWGHNGGVIGHLTFSYHSEDGRRQVSSAENLVTQDPATATAVAQARAAMQVTALCGSQPDARTAATVPVPPTADVTVRR